jgi:hypothetical protein
MPENLLFYLTFVHRLFTLCKHLPLFYIYSLTAIIFLFLKNFFIIYLTLTGGVILFIIFSALNKWLYNSRLLNYNFLML